MAGSRLHFSQIDTGRFPDVQASEYMIDIFCQLHRWLISGLTISEVLKTYGKFLFGDQAEWECSSGADLFQNFRPPRVV